MALDLKLKVDWNALRNPPKPVKITVIVLPSVLVIALTVFLAILPKNTQIKTLDEEIATQEKDISEKQSMAANLEQLKVENAKLKEKLIELEEQLPAEDEISTLLKQVTDLTLEAGLEINTWTPEGKRGHSSGIVYEVPVRISLNGSYHNFGRFFSSVTKLQRIINFTSIGLTTPTVKGNSAILSLNMTAVTFVAVPDKKID